MDVRCNDAGKEPNPIRRHSCVPRALESRRAVFWTEGVAPLRRKGTTAVRMDSRWGRVARGWAAAGFATIVAAVSHTLAGGNTPTFFALAVSVIISGMACTLLAGRTLSFWRLGASVALSQVLFHTVFSGLGTPVAAAHSHAPALLEAGPSHHDGAMWMAHVGAGLITLAALRYAETAFWGIASTARLFFARLIAAVALPEPRVAQRHRIALDRAILPRATQRILSPMRYRGPPATLGAL